MVYSTSAKSIGGRDGVTALNDGTMSVRLARPGTKAFGHNPEQLFALGYAACFDSALHHSALRMKLPLTASETTAEVGLEKVGESFRLAVTISVSIKGLGRDQARALIETAHKVCPYSNALRGNADVNVRLAA